MKKVSMIVVVIKSALVIGCQENGHFNPVGSDTHGSGTAVKPESSNPDGIFELDQQVKSVDNTFNLVGQIQYTLVPAGDDAFAFSLVTDATLESVEPKEGGGTIYGESIDPVFLNGKQLVSYERVYRVDNFKDKDFNLHIRFNLAPDQVEITGIWLSEALPKSDIVKR